MTDVSFEPSDQPDQNGTWEPEPVDTQALKFAPVDDDTPPQDLTPEELELAFTTDPAPFPETPIHATPDTPVTGAPAVPQPVSAPPVPPPDVQTPVATVTAPGIPGFPPLTLPEIDNRPLFSPQLEQTLAPPRCQVVRMTLIHREHQATALDLLTQRLGSANQLIGANPSQHTDSVQAEFDNSLSATNFGTYDAENGGTIYLDARLLDKPALLQDVFNEELGHHLDSVLGGNDARGDKGAVFSQFLTWGILDQKTLLQLQVEQDHGYIDVDGEQFAVEFRSAEEG